MDGRPRDRIAGRANRFAGAASAVDRLRAALDDHGVIGREDIRAVAARTHLPIAAVAGSSSFYADFALAQRKSRHVRICRGTACFVACAGVDPRADTDADTSVQSVHCLGFCFAAPALLDNGLPRTGPDQQPGPPIPYACAAPRSVVLAGLCGDESAWQVWPEMLASGLRDRVMGEVAGSGLRGRGGAEFPAAEKWRAAQCRPRPRQVIANGDEGDPGSFCDRLLLECDPHRVLEGLALCGYAVGADQGTVLVRSEYPAALAAMRRAVEQARAAGHLGSNVHGSGLAFDVAVSEGAGSYTAGEETGLLRALTGLRGSVQARPPYPTDCGFAGRPTVVHNVETLAAIPWIVRHGGAAYARLGRSSETGTKLVSLSAGFAEPGVYEVEFGTPLREIVERLGGGARAGRLLRAVQVGGPLGGFLGSGDLDIGLADTDLAARGISLGHGGIVAIDDRVSGGALLRQLWQFAAAESCGACAPCRVGTRRGLEMSMRAAPIGPELPRLLDIMRTGSLCAFGTGVAAAVHSLVRVYSDELGEARP
ncbi:NADH-ubiquinone oxidoreductase-F iron-sulfur binding region domain-containing protein [Nocardia brasiliensis]|uniref:NADH-ubiquinone oxidoreductase-F iron-sulfur binding region domain-containing protein n=1 Tax=Nocardia brasiliensis TaxID=37326 RepID=UPI0009DED96E|nr:NADH-ubiquinone oxidoreductase-F iron-sulfur binding region domain-containing protein [Nocardia brasiliensis]